MAHILLLCRVVIPLMGVGVILDRWARQFGDGNCISIFGKLILMSCFFNHGILRTRG
jgi:hypothetical protein